MKKKLQKNVSFGWIFIPGLLQALSYLSWIWLPLNQSAIRPFFWSLLVTWICFFWWRYLLHRMPSTNRIFATLLVFGVLFRLIVFFLPAILANDYLRYLFDGRLLGNHINPYAVTPLDYPDLIIQGLPKPDVMTIYPPLAEGLFWITYQLGDSLWSWRLLSALADIGCLILIVNLLQRYKASLNLVFLYWCNPIIIKEFSNSGHLDIWTLFFILLFFYFSGKHKTWQALIALSCGVLVKLVPVVLFLPWIRSFSGRFKMVQVSLAGCLLVILPFSFFYPFHPFGSLFTFFSSIEGSGVLFFFLNLFFTSSISRLILTISGGVVIILMVEKINFRITDHYFPGLELILVIFIFSTTGFPWYMGALIPLLFTSDNRYILALMATSQIIYYYQGPSPVSLLFYFCGLFCIVGLLKQVYFSVQS